MKLNFKEWKKVGQTDTHTTFRNKENHELKVAHKLLHPAVRGQLAALPMAKGSDPTQQHLLPGDATPNKTEKGVVAHAKSRMADGGEVPEPDKKKAQDMQDSSQQSGWQPRQWASNVKSGLGMADGGKVPDPAASPEPSQQQKSQDLADQIKDPTLRRQLEKGARGFAGGGQAAIEADLGEAPPAPPADDVASPPPNSTPAPQNPTSSTPPAPPVDAALQQKRSIYNSLVTGAPDAKGGTPDAEDATPKMFGANGSPPSSFDASAWNKAEQMFTEQSQEKAQAAVKGAQDATEENKARQAAGLPPVPVPDAPQSAPQQSVPYPDAQAPAATPGDGSFDAFSKSVDASQKRNQAIQQQAYDDAKQAHLDYQNRNATIQQERDNVAHDIANGHIDPDRYVGSMGAGKKVATAIGLILGGIGGGMTHSGNPAQEFLNAQIERDMESQKADLGKKQNLLSSYQQQLRDNGQAEAMTRITLNDMMAHKIELAASKSGSPEAMMRAQQAKLGFLQNSNQLQMQMANSQALRGQNSDTDPASLVPLRVPKDLHEAVYKEIERAQDTRRMAGKISEAYNAAVEDLKTVKGTINPVHAAALQQALMPTFKDLEGTVRQAAIDSAKKNFTPTKLDLITGDSDVRKRSLEDYIQSKASAPRAKSYGIDLDKFKSTTSDPVMRLTPVQKQYYDFAKANPQDPRSPLLLKKLGF